MVRKVPGEPLHQAWVRYKGGSSGQGEADLGTMETQKDSRFLGGWSLFLLLLGLVMPSASTQALSLREAALRAVDAFNRQSSDPNLYRLLELDQEPIGVSQDWGSGGVLWPGSVPLLLTFLTLSLLSGFMSSSQCLSPEWRYW